MQRADGSEQRARRRRAQLAAPPINLGPGPHQQAPFPVGPARRPRPRLLGGGGRLRPGRHPRHASRPAPARARLPDAPWRWSRHHRRPQNTPPAPRVPGPVPVRLDLSEADPLRRAQDEDGLLLETPLQAHRLHPGPGRRRAVDCAPPRWPRAPPHAQAPARAAAPPGGGAGGPGVGADDEEEGVCAHQLLRQGVGPQRRRGVLTHQRYLQINSPLPHVAYIGAFHPSHALPTSGCQPAARGRRAGGV